MESILWFITTKDYYGGTLYYDKLKKEIESNDLSLYFYSKPEYGLVLINGIGTVIAVDKHHIYCKISKENEVKFKLKEIKTYATLIEDPLKIGNYAFLLTRDYESIPESITNMMVVDSTSIMEMKLIPWETIKTDDPGQELLVRYHTEYYPSLLPLEVYPQGDFVDLRSAETVALKKGESYLISTGISMKAPEGYWIQVVARSSTYKNHKVILTNAFGVVDESYCGDNDIIKILVIALEDTKIELNDRIAQFRIVKKQPFTIKVVDHLEGPDRGGFGSTGTK